MVSSSKAMTSKLNLPVETETEREDLMVTDPMEIDPMEMTGSEMIEEVTDPEVVSTAPKKGTLPEIAPNLENLENSTIVTEEDVISEMTEIVMIEISDLAEKDKEEEKKTTAEAEATIKREKIEREAILEVTDSQCSIIVEFFFLFQYNLNYIFLSIFALLLMLNILIYL